MPLSKKKKDGKRSDPSTSRSRASSKKGNTRKSASPALNENNPTTSTSVGRTETHGSDRIDKDHTAAHAYQADFLNDCDFSFTAVAIEETAQKNTARIIDAIKANQLRQQLPDATHVETTPQVFAAEEGYTVKQQKGHKQRVARPFLLTDEDREYVREFFLSNTPEGKSPPDLQEITRMMELRGDEENAKHFLDEIESRIARSSPPQSRSLAKLRRDPFIRDISGLRGPIYQYRQDGDRVED